MHGSILLVTNPPAQATPGTSPALRARGWGIIRRGPISGLGGGENKNIFSLILLSTRYFSRGLQDSCGPQDYVFSRKTQELVGEWLERNNLSKLKSAFKGMF